MTSIQGYERLCKEHIPKSSLRSLLPPRSNYDKLLIDFFIIDHIDSLFGPFVTIYPEKNPQKIFKTVLEIRIFFCNKPCKKLLKARLSNEYCDKSHMKCYNFWQKYEDQFAIARAKNLNRILFATFFLHYHINFYW